MFGRSVVCLTWFCWILKPTALMAGEADFFATQVRPILSAHCFKCHGPDEKTRKGQLRLDVREKAVETLAPGKPDESELLRRIHTTEPSEVMPPPSAKMPLTAEQKKILHQWIAQGAKYSAHWAFTPPKQPPLPKVKNQQWVRNPIDAFVLAKLEANELSPSPEADRTTLIRRLSYDLIGLPPTPAEVDEFLSDSSPNAYEKLVDRLLASPHYGERWARRWLDLARYADTNGYEKDRPRSIWPYRDWVIRAINADMPFDQFTIEQIAGDMLPNASIEQRIATGFHRNTMLNEEGGIDPLEFRYYAMVDRINTTGTIWLGLTLGCAQCHTHKYDSITQREYFQLLAFLNNADEPELELRTGELGQKYAQIEQQIAELEAKLADHFPLNSDPNDLRPLDQRRKAHLEASLVEWANSERAKTVRWRVLRPTEVKGSLPLLTVLPDASVLASGDQSKSDTYTLRFTTDLRGVTAIRLEVLPDERLPNKGPGRVYYEGPSGDFFLSEFRVSVAGKSLPIRQATHSYADSKHPVRNAVDGDPQTGWSIQGGQGKQHSAVFCLEKPIDVGSELQIEMLFERYYAAGLGRFRISVTTDEQNLSARPLPGDVEDALALPPHQWTPAQKDRLLRHYLSIVADLADARQKIDALKKQLPKLPTTLVMQERPPENPRATVLYHRGEYLQPREMVSPGTLAILPPLATGVPKNRLSFARWLVSEQNPLVGRVTMNRAWAAFFGRGIVKTVQDFGYQGDFPTHPELLDYLALELIRQRWSMKAMHRLIVNSSTYRQSSRLTEELRAKDPENLLLARGPRVRLEAEQIRDGVLRSAGLLSSKLGGPSVFPPQPPGVTTEGTYGRLDWKVSSGPDRYRRGLYTFTKRTAPYAMFLTFDGPSGEVCQARREVSNTPLQALTLLNDPVFVEAAQRLGQEFASRPGTDQERIHELFRRCLTRRPSLEEQNLLVQFLQAQRNRLTRRELNPTDISGTQEGDTIERAAWTVLTRSLLNLDEAITKE